MKKELALILCIFSMGLSHAQQAEITKNIENISSTEAVIAGQTTLQNNDKVGFEVKGYEDCDLQLINSYGSKIGKHELYVQIYKGYPVYGAYIKVNSNLAGQVISSYHTLIQPALLNKTDASQIANQTHWLMHNGKLIAARAENNNHIFSLKQENGTTLYAHDLRLYFTDTTSTGMVFNPDPITTAGVVYGKNGTYKNFNDSDYALLNDQRISGLFPTTFDNGTFHLANKYSIIKDIEAPTFVPVTSTNGVFNFTRSQHGFKEVMAMYHIYRLQLYMQSLGYNDLVNYQLKVDPHASTADQSYFSYSDGDTLLRFGTGGVPDAEDADVIVHEYTHAISFSLNPDGAESSDRKAIEEGLCDAMACAYSKRINPFLWRNIFSWDGHNEYWSGRNGSSSKTYDDRIGSYYSDSEIWSSAMNNLIEVLGEDVVIKLLLASIPQFSRFTSMPEAASIMYETDSIINNKVNQGYLSLEFNARKFGSFPVGLSNIITTDIFTISNTYGFANGTGNATLKPGNLQKISVDIFGVNGRNISTLNGNEIILNPSDFKAGVYFLQIRSQETNGYYKLIRY